MIQQTPGPGTVPQMAESNPVRVDPGVEQYLAARDAKLLWGYRVVLVLIGLVLAARQHLALRNARSLTVETPEALDSYKLAWGAYSDRLWESMIGGFLLLSMIACLGLGALRQSGKGGCLADFACALLLLKWMFSNMLAGG